MKAKELVIGETYSYQDPRGREVEVTFQGKSWPFGMYCFTSIIGKEPVRVSLPEVTVESRIN